LVAAIRRRQFSASSNKLAESRRNPSRIKAAFRVGLAFAGILPLISKNAKAQERPPMPQKPPIAQAEATLEGPPKPRITPLGFPGWILSLPPGLGQWEPQAGKLPEAEKLPAKGMPKADDRKKSDRKNGGEADSEKVGAPGSGEEVVFAPCGMPEGKKEEPKEEGKKEGAQKKDGRKRAQGSKPFDLGMNFTANEAGEAVYLRLAYKNGIKLDAGTLAFWEGEAAPYGRLLLTPEAGSGDFRARYYGSYGFAYNMPSWLYSSHAGAIGHRIPVGKNSILRYGGVIGGAFSVMNLDDFYVNLAIGISLEIGKRLLLYAMPTAYMNTDIPMANKNIGSFKPKIHNVEAGAQVSPEGMPSFAAFAKIGWIGTGYGISNEYGIRATHTFRAKNGSTDPEMGVWVSGGLTQWSPIIWNGGIEPTAGAGMGISFSGADVRSTNIIEFSRLQRAGMGISSTSWEYFSDEWGVINELLNSKSFDEFAAAPGNLPEEELITRTRYLGDLLHGLAFNEESGGSKRKWNIFSAENRKLAEVGNEEVFQFVKRYIKWAYANTDTNKAVPEEFANGKIVCSGIHWFLAEYLRRNGVDAITVAVNRPDGPHAIVAARFPGRRVVLLDYGTRFDTIGTLDEALRHYGKVMGAYALQPQFSGQDGYVGAYVTTEGRLVHKALGLEPTELLKKDFLGVK
jgi:hypothetical protein